MNKQRRVGRTCPKRNFLETRVIYDSGLKLDKYFDENVRLNVMKNRSCYFSPDMKDFGQLTECLGNDGQKYQTHENDFHRESREIADLFKSVKNILSNCLPKDTRQSSYIGPNKQGACEKILGISNRLDSTNYDERNKLNIAIKDVRIAEKPRIKIIAEKFARYKINGVEVRKLEQRIVCVEYDVYSAEVETNPKPVQVLRAYFSVAPLCLTDNVSKSPGISSESKQNRAIDEDDKNEKGIEIIDAKIPQNKPYLEELKRFLKSKESNRLRNLTSLNPMCLYKMAKKNFISEEVSYTGLLSKSELDEIKEMILKKTTSSVHGISRRKLRPGRDTGIDVERMGDREDSIIDEILKFM
ncbi:unnamed protein product, partial [Iphiclides podalirius]